MKVTKAVVFFLIFLPSGFCCLFANTSTLVESLLEECASSSITGGDDELFDIIAKGDDELFRFIARRHGNPPAVNETFGTTYGSVQREVNLYRGVAGPDHNLESVIRLFSGDRKHELMSPSFRDAVNRRSNEPFDNAYLGAQVDVANEIRSMVSNLGLRGFAFSVFAHTSAGLAFNRKKGPIVKFSNYINSALKYADSAYKRNLDRGQRFSPVVFDASGHGDLVLGTSDLSIPRPQAPREYDFLSNVAIRHINAMYIGLKIEDFATVYEMPWIKITPQTRKPDGSFLSFTVEFVHVEKKIEADIFSQTGTWPEYDELTNLTPRKYVGSFDIDGSMDLSPNLSNRELDELKSFLNQLHHWHDS